MQLILDIPDEKVPIVKAAFKGIYTIPKDDEDNPVYTDNAWTEICIKRFIIRTVARYKQSQDKQPVESYIDNDVVS